METFERWSLEFNASLVVEKRTKALLAARLLLPLELSGKDGSPNMDVESSGAEDAVALEEKHVQRREG